MLRDIIIRPVVLKVGVAVALSLGGIIYTIFRTKRIKSPNSNSSATPNSTGGGSGRGRRQSRGDDVVHRLKVSLEDLYSGITKKLSHSRNVICSKCSGKGSKSGASTKCSGCKGTGMKVSIRQRGPGMIQQMQHHCNESRVLERPLATRVVALNVKVKKWYRRRKPLKFMLKKECKMDRKLHSLERLMKRRKNTRSSRERVKICLVDYTLTLTDALCGFQFILTNLDGRQLIKSSPGEVVKPDQFKAINDEGMPLDQRPFMRGKLYIHFIVEFPDSLSPEQVKTLEAILPPRPISHYSDMELYECEETDYIT